MTDIRIYANKNCPDCNGSGEVEIVIDTIEVHGRMWDVPGWDYCWCIADRLEGVRFRYYFYLDAVPEDDDIPF